MYVFFERWDLVCQTHMLAQPASHLAVFSNIWNAGSVYCSKFVYLDSLTNESPVNQPVVILKIFRILNSCHIPGERNIPRWSPKCSEFKPLSCWFESVHPELGGCYLVTVTTNKDRFFSCKMIKLKWTTFVFFGSLFTRCRKLLFLCCLVWLVDIIPPIFWDVKKVVLFRDGERFCMCWFISQTPVSRQNEGRTLESNPVLPMLWVGMQFFKPRGCFPKCTLGGSHMDKGAAGTGTKHLWRCAGILSTHHQKNG